MATRKRAGLATSSSVPDNGGDHSGGGGSAGGAHDGVFSTYLYEGTGTTRNIENGIDLADEGGMVWIKARTLGNESAINHCIADTESAGSGPNLYQGSTNTSDPYKSPSNQIKGFTSNGFTVGDGKETNGSGSSGYEKTYASWTFRKAPKFFDVVTYTGDGVAGREIPHNLGVKPGMIIVKCTSDDGSWVVYHQDLGGSNYYIYLNSTAGRSNNSQMWNSDPTDSVFRVGNGTDVNSAHGKEYVAYLFAHDDSDESMIKCGSFPGRYSTIDLGFEPQWVLMKPANSDGPWTMLDTMRGWTAQESVGSSPLRANENSAEIQGDTSLGYITSTGFYVGNVGTANHIYMAIRRPTKHASEFEPEELFDVGVGDGVDPDPSMRTPMVADAGIITQVDRTSQNTISSRITGTSVLWTDATSAENTQADMRWDYQNGFWVGNSAYHSFNYWAWRRAPGFFDVVAYDGTNGSRNLPHNLGVVPTMIWTKMRDGAEDWCVIHGQNESDMSNIVTGLSLNTPTAAQVVDQDYSAVHTASTFNPKFIKPSTNVGDGASTGKHIAYLFASVPGISKTGGYTGTGATQYIDCGFTTSCRFVLIKRVDADGDWMIVDTERGFISGMNPFIFLNSTAAPVDDFRVYPYPQGFQLSDDASVNAVGGKYIFYAIA